MMSLSQRLVRSVPVSNGSLSVNALGSRRARRAIRQQPVQEGFFVVGRRRRRDRADTLPDYVEDTRYSRRVRLSFIATSSANITITTDDLQTAIGITQFRRCMVSRVDAWCTSLNSTSGPLAPAIRVRTYLPSGNVGTVASIDREFQDVGVAGAHPAHVAVSAHGTIRPYITTPPTAHTVLAIMEPTTGAQYTVDFQCTFYDTDLTVTFTSDPSGRLLCSRGHWTFPPELIEPEDWSCVDGD